MKKLLALVVLLIALCVVFEKPILRSFANFLMRQDEPEKADAIVVLSGNSFDRGREAAKLFKQGFAPYIICPGGNLEREFVALGDTLYESDVCKRSIVRNGIPDALIRVIHRGTSTIEEADTMLDYCRAHQLHKIIVVTSLFHTRRAGGVYHKRFAGSGIKVIMRGAHDSVYNERRWWKNEYGLLALNNEYMKTLYYLFKEK